MKYSNVERAGQTGGDDHLCETLHTGSLACSYEGRRLRAGKQYLHQTYSNITEHYITRYIYEICCLAHDIAGGFIATLPSEKLTGRW